MKSFLTSAFPRNLKSILTFRFKLCYHAPAAKSFPIPLAGSLPLGFNFLRNPPLFFPVIPEYRKPADANTRTTAPNPVHPLMKPTSQKTRSFWSGKAFFFHSTGSGQPSVWTPLSLLRLAVALGISRGTEKFNKHFGGRSDLLASGKQLRYHS